MLWSNQIAREMSKIFTKKIKFAVELNKIEQQLVDRGGTCKNQVKKVNIEKKIIIVEE